MDSLTNLLAPLLSSRAWFVFTNKVFIIEIVIGFTYILFFRWIWRKTSRRIIKHIILRQILLVISFSFFILFSIIILFTVGLTSQSYDSWISNRYFVLNAAVKNTCYLDPLKRNCPKTLKELIAIEPENFSRLLKGNLFYGPDIATYQYYPETNEYTLIIRENNMAVIFDPRLKKVKDYGSIKNAGYDFTDIKVKGCCGNYSIANPPPFPGPWDHIN